MENLRLNNFILWCKGWYWPVKYELPIFEQAKKALYLDGYEFITHENNVLEIITSFVDDLVESKTIKPIKTQIIFQKINYYKYYYKSTDNEALLWFFHDYFAYELTSKELKLNPPTYNRRLFKLGFRGSSNIGDSYKMLNCKAKKYFNIKK
jgi:hypothetical protein